MYGTRDRPGRIASGAPLESSSSLFQTGARHAEGEETGVSHGFVLAAIDAGFCIRHEVTL
jgi:hypothetical protein